MREITLIMAYYENPTMLATQLESIRRMSKEVRCGIRLIVVDDGSPDNPAEELVISGVPVEIYRIDVDVRWNQDAARNIGAHHCQTEWMLLTDMDHMVPETTWQYVQTAKLSDLGIYKFSRVTAPMMDAYKPHPNSYLMTKRMWARTGGYDERFAGLYGTDGDFRDRVVQVAPVSSLPYPIVRVPREFIADASTTRYARKQPEDLGIKVIKERRALTPGWRPLTLTFPYHRVTLGK